MKSELELPRFRFRSLALAITLLIISVMAPSASAQPNQQAQAAPQAQAQPACTPPAASTGDQSKAAAAESGVSKAANSISSIGSIFGKKKPSPTADKVVNAAEGCDATVNNAVAAAQTVASGQAGTTISSMLSSASGGLSSACNQAIASNPGAAAAVSKTSSATSTASNLSSAAGAKNDPQKAAQTANAAVNCNPAGMVPTASSGAAAPNAPSALASTPAPVASAPAAKQQKPSQPQKAPAAAPPNAAGPFTPPPNVKIEPTVVGPATTTYAYAVSPHGAHVATNTHDGSRQVIIYDGVEGPKFDQIYPEGPNGAAPVIFSPDGNRFAYCGQMGDQWVVVVDGKILVQSGDSVNGAIGETSCELGFTANSKHVYFTTMVSVKGSNSAAQRFVFDGKAGPPGVSGPVAFSPDGDHFAYTWVDPLNQTTHGSFVIDGKPTNDMQSSPQWTADGQHLYTKRPFSSAASGTGTAMDILRDGKQIMRVDNALLYIPPVGDMMVAVVQKTRTPQSSFLVIGGQQVPGSENAGQSAGIADVVFSPDGKHYSALYHTLNGQQFAFSDGKKGLNYPRLNGISSAGIGQHVMAFTADSSKLVYIGFNAADNGQFLVINGQESQELFAVTDTVFSPVGNHVATDGQGLVTLDGKILSLANVNPRAATASQMTFSPDGTHFAFRLQTGGTIAVYLDGVATGYASSSADSNSFVFSPDSQHFAYFCRPASAVSSNDQGLCLDGKYLPFPPGIFQYSNMTFSPDSKHLFWRGQLPPYGYRIFVDGNPAFDGQLNQGSTLYPKESWQMGADGALTVLTTDANSFKRVRISVTP
jgi:Tol biopolymer transport system component